MSKLITKKCLTCNGKGVIPITWCGLKKGDRCPRCQGKKTIQIKEKSINTLELDPTNTRELPNAPGMWYYNATNLTVFVFDRDGELYFRSLFHPEEMKVSEFNDKRTFTKLEEKPGN